MRLRNINLKRALPLTILVIFFTGLLAIRLAVLGSPQDNFAGIVPAVQAKENDKGNRPQKCINASMRGRFGYTYSGKVTGFGPISATGPITFDGEGNVSATYTVSLNGVPFNGSFTGTYSVKPDCTASITLNLPTLGIESHGSFVIVDDGEEAFFMGTDMGVNVTGVARKQ